MYGVRVRLSPICRYATSSAPACTSQSTPTAKRSASGLQRRCKPWTRLSGPSLPALLTLLDVPSQDPGWHPLDPHQRRQRILDAVQHLLLRALHRDRPPLVLIEDVHWLDGQTQALLDRLVDSLPTARILLLVSYRPEYQHGWGSKTSYTQLRLDPLPLTSAPKFLQALLGDDASLVPVHGC